jgi:hypothetical protein
VIETVDITTLQETQNFFKAGESLLTTGLAVHQDRSLLPPGHYNVFV